MKDLNIHLVNKSSALIGAKSIFGTIKEFKGDLRPDAVQYVTRILRHLHGKDFILVPSKKAEAIAHKKLAHITKEQVHTAFNREDLLIFTDSKKLEDYLTTFETNFNLFSQSNIGFENFPPLEHKFGLITAKNNLNTLLSARIRNVQIQNPILTFTENGSKRKAFLLGENIWKWRLENHLRKKHTPWSWVRRR